MFIRFWDDHTWKEINTEYGADFTWQMMKVLKELGYDLPIKEDRIKGKKTCKGQCKQTFRLNPDNFISTPANKDGFSSWCKRCMVQRATRSNQEKKNLEKQVKEYFEINEEETENENEKGEQNGNEHRTGSIGHPC